MIYLVAIHHPYGYDGSKEDAQMGHDIDALNQQMIAAEVRLFAGGLQPVKAAKCLRKQNDGNVMVTDGPYLETKEHVGGISRL